MSFVSKRLAWKSDVGFREGNSTYISSMFVSFWWNYWRWTTHKSSCEGACCHWENPEKRSPLVPIHSSHVTWLQDLTKINGFFPSFCTSVLRKTETNKAHCTDKKRGIKVRPLGSHRDSMMWRQKNLYPGALPDGTLCRSLQSLR